MLRFTLLTTTALMAGLASVALALDQNIDAQAQFRQALTMTVNNRLDFTSSGKIDYLGTAGAGDVVSMATNGAIVYTGSVFTGPGTGTAGDITLTGNPGDHVNISCTATATISDGNAHTLTVSGLALDMNTGTATLAGAAYACAGTGTSPYDFALTGTDHILLGGEIIGNTGTIVSAIYKTDNSGGTPATVRVVYQ